jgi:hypothetical protein
LVPFLPSFFLSFFLSPPFLSQAFQLIRTDIRIIYLVRLYTDLLARNLYDKIA